VQTVQCVGEFYSVDPHLVSPEQKAQPEAAAMRLTGTLVGSVSIDRD
jgi:hypothetical protein